MLSRVPSHALDELLRSAVAQGCSSKTINLEEKVRRSRFCQQVFAV